MIPELLAVGAAYLLGSLPFSFLVARLAGVRDIRQVGSGNVGATNVMRSAGPLPGLLAFGLDAGKGALAVALAARLDASGRLAALAAAGAVIGHMFPVWLRFKGGKGVATGAGAFAPLAPLASLGALLVFAIVLAATRFVSLGSIAGALALSALLFALDAPPTVAATGLALSLLIVYRHRENLERLARGTERRLGARR